VVPMLPLSDADKAAFPEIDPSALDPLAAKRDSPDCDPGSAGAKLLFDARTVERKVLVPFTGAEGATGHSESADRHLYHQRLSDWLDETLGDAARAGGALVAGLVLLAAMTVASGASATEAATASGQASSTRDGAERTRAIGRAGTPFTDVPPCCDTTTWPSIWYTDFPGTLTSFQLKGSDGTTFNATDGAYYVALTPDGTKAYVTRQFSDNDTSVVVPVDLTSHVAGSPISIPGTATAIAIGPGGKTVYVTTDSGYLTLIDTASNAVRTQIALGGSTPGVAISPNGAAAFVIVDNAVIPIDTRTTQPTPRIPVSPTPQAITITPDGKTVYVASSNGDVTPIATATNKAGTAIALGGNSSSITTTPDGVAVLVVNGTTVVPVNVATNKPGRAVQIGDGGLRIVASSGSAYIPHYASSVISNVGWTSAGQLRPYRDVQIDDQVFDIAAAADQAPVARLAVRVAPAGRATTFDATASTTKFSVIDHFDWDFGDGTRMTTEVAPWLPPNNPAHVYAKPGTYTVRVTAVNQLGTSTQKIYTGQGTVVNGGPSATVTKRIVVPAR
jgi:YVTN family beta-propeller protein